MKKKLFLWTDLPCLAECNNGVCFVMAETRDIAIAMVEASDRSFPGLIEEMKAYDHEELEGDDAWGYAYGQG